MKKSFRLKVIMSFLIGILCCIVVLILSCRFMLRPIFIYDTKSSMKNYSELVIDAYEGGSVTVTRLLDMLESSHDIESVVYKDDFTVICNSQQEIYPNSYKMDLLKEWMDVYHSSEIKDGVYCGEIKDNTDNLDRVVFIKQIGDDTFLCMSKVVRGIDQEVRIANYVIAAVGLIIGFISIVLWSVLTRPFTQQMEKMSTVTKNMSQLNFEEKINYNSGDEIGVLAKSIDEMSDELKRSIDKLQKDVERRKRLIRDISHELKTPVTTIRGYTENIQILASDNERISRYCDIMIEESDVIDSLVGEMLYMSKLEDDGYECEMALLDLGKIEKTLRSRLLNSFPDEKIDISFGDGKVAGNDTLCERAILNFIANAVKHRKPGTEITVRGYSEKDGYVFCVSNFGSQISSEDAEHIWDVFYKSDKSRNRQDKGHGIGLAIVKQIALIHGGKVWVESKDGINTFYIKIKT